MSSKTLMLTGLISLPFPLAVQAVEPVGADAFNFAASVDLAALTVGNFEEMLSPAARASEEGPDPDRRHG